ncbi:nuclear pore protein [Lineolata rhizophorae]|uniref:Nuclear pore protein n=1 Tax=Lineolata rhizophorae TaxID=578093 RepID=A0A6A6NU83_9PEZI|nr:nuclear pore protein [Lineolata rhizophorae]
MADPERGFQTFSHGHQDLVLAVDFNFYGTRMVTASSDQRLKVWDRNTKKGATEQWTLVDSWRAHDAEIVDVKWNGPLSGIHIGSISEDGRFRLWAEDVTETPNSSRRFKPIYQHYSETKVPFMSLDFKNQLADTILALVSRDGYLTIHEPSDPDRLTEWHCLTASYVYRAGNGGPDRQDETSFRVAWHKEPLPCWQAIAAGLDRRALSLAVAAMDTVRIYRTDHNRQFYVAAELPGHRGLVRDVAWANGSMRGYDLLATACKDGAIRVFELHASPQQQQPQQQPHGTSTTSLSTVGPTGSAYSALGSPHIQHPLAGGAGVEAGPGRIIHNVRPMAELVGHHGAVWRVAFSQAGDLLVSTGDDGAIRTWKKSHTGQWLEYAEIGAGRADV